MGSKAGHDSTWLPSSETKKLNPQIQAQKLSWRLSTPWLVRKFPRDSENDHESGLWPAFLEDTQQPRTTMPRFQAII